MRTHSRCSRCVQRTAGLLGRYLPYVLTISTALMSSSCQTLKLSSPYEKHFAAVRAAAKVLDEAVNRKPFDLHFAEDKPLPLARAVNDVAGSLASDPSLDANYLSRARQLSELYEVLGAYSYRILRPKMSGNQRQIEYWLPIFRQAARNAEAGYYDDWKAVKALSIFELDRQASILEYSAREESLARRDADAAAARKNAAQAVERSTCQAGPVLAVTGKLKDTMYGHGGDGFFKLQPEIGPAVDFNVAMESESELPVFDHQVAEWENLLPRRDQIGMTFTIRYRDVTCSNKKPDFDKQLSAIERR